MPKEPGSRGMKTVAAPAQEAINTEGQRFYETHTLLPDGSYVSNEIFNNIATPADITRDTWLLIVKDAIGSGRIPKAVSTDPDITWNATKSQWEKVTATGSEYINPKAEWDIYAPDILPKIGTTPPVVGEKQVIHITYAGRPEEEINWTWDGTIWKKDTPSWRDTIRDSIASGTVPNSAEIIVWDSDKQQWKHTVGNTVTYSDPGKNPEWDQYKPSSGKLTPDEQSKLRELGLTKFNDWYGLKKIVETGYTMLESKDADGKNQWIRTDSYNKLTAEEQAKLNEWGVGDQFNTWLSDKKTVEAGYVKTGKEEWVKAADITDLGKLEAPILAAPLLDSTNPKLGASFSNSSNWTAISFMDPGTGNKQLISTVDYIILNEEEKKKLDELGADEFNKWHSKISATEITLVKYATSEQLAKEWTKLKFVDEYGNNQWVSTEAYEKLLPDEQAKLDELGTTKFNEWYKINGTTVEKKKLLELGVEKFNEWSKSKAKDDYLKAVDKAKAVVQAKIDSVTPKAIPPVGGTGAFKGFTGSQYIRLSRGDVPAWMLVPDFNGAFTPNGAEAMGTSYGPSIMGVKYAIQSPQEYRISGWGYASIGGYPMYGYRFKDKSGNDVWIDQSNYQMSREGLTPVNWTEDTYLAYVGVSKDKVLQNLQPSYKQSDMAWNSFFGGGGQYNYIDPETGKATNTEGLINPYGVLDANGKVVQQMGPVPIYGSGVWTQAARTAFQGTDIGMVGATGRISDYLVDPRTAASRSEQVAQAAKTFQATGKLPPFDLMKEANAIILAQFGISPEVTKIAPLPVTLKTPDQLDAVRAWDLAIDRARAGEDVGALKSATDAFFAAESASAMAAKRAEQRRDVPGEWTSKAKTFMTGIEKQLNAPVNVSESVIKSIQSFINDAANNVKVLPSGEMIANNIYNSLEKNDQKLVRTSADMENIIVKKYVITADGKDLITKDEMVEGVSDKAKSELKIIADQMLTKMKEQVEGVSVENGGIPEGTKIDYDTVQYTKDGKILFETYYDKVVTDPEGNKSTIKSSDYDQLTADGKKAFDSWGQKGLDAYKTDLSHQTERFQALASKQVTFESLLQDIEKPETWKKTDIAEGLIGSRAVAEYSQKGWSKLWDDLWSGKLSKPYDLTTKPIIYEPTKYDNVSTLDKIDSILTDSIRKGLTLGMDITPTYDVNKVSQEYDQQMLDFKKAGQEIPFTKDQYIGMTLQNQIPLLELGAQMMPFEYYRPGRAMSGMQEWQKVVFPILDVVSLIPFAALAIRGVAAGTKFVSLGAKIAAAGGREAIEYAAKQAALNIPKAMAKAELHVIVREMTENIIKSVAKQAGKLTAEDAAKIVANQIKTQTSKLLKLANELGTDLEGLVGSKGMVRYDTLLRIAQADTKSASQILQAADKVADLAQRELSAIRTNNDALQKMVKGAEALKSNIGEKVYTSTDKISRILSGMPEAVQAKTAEARINQAVRYTLKGGDIGSAAVISSTVIQNWDELPNEGRGVGIALAAFSMGLGNMPKKVWIKFKEYGFIDAVPGKALRRGAGTEAAHSIRDPLSTIRMTLTPEQIKSSEITMALKYVRDSIDEQTIVGKDIGVTYFVKGDQAEDFAKWYNDVNKLGHENALTPDMKEIVGINPKSTYVVMASPEDYARLKAAVDFGDKSRIGVTPIKILEPAEYYRNMKAKEGIPIQLEKIEKTGPGISAVLGTPTIFSGSPYGEMWQAGTGTVLDKLMNNELQNIMTMVGKESGAYFAAEWLPRFSKKAALASSQKAGKANMAVIMVAFDHITKLPPDLEKIRVIKDMEQAVKKTYNDLGKPIPPAIIHGFKKFQTWLEMEVVIRNNTDLRKLANWRTKLYKIFGQEKGTAKTYLPDTGEAVEILQFYEEHAKNPHGLTLQEIYNLKGKALQNELKDIEQTLKNGIETIKRDRFKVLTDLVDRIRQDMKVGETTVADALKAVGQSEIDFLNLRTPVTGTGEYVQGASLVAEAYADKMPDVTKVEVPTAKVAEPKAGEIITKAEFVGASAKSDIDIPDSNKIEIKNLEYQYDDVSKKLTVQLQDKILLADRGTIQIETTKKGRYATGATLVPGQGVKAYINGKRIYDVASVNYGDYIRLNDTGFTFIPKEMYIPVDKTSTIDIRAVKEWLDDNIDRLKDPIDRVSIIKEVGDEIKKPIIDIGNATDHEMGMFLGNLVTGAKSEIPSDVDFIMVGHAAGFGDDWNARGVRIKDIVNRSVEPGKKVYVVACDDFNKRSAVKIDGVMLESDPRATLSDGREVPVSAKDDWIPDSKKPVLRNESLRKDANGIYTRTIVPLGEFGEFHIELSKDQQKVAMYGSTFEVREGVTAFLNGKKVHSRTIDVRYGDYIRFEDDFGVSFMPEDLSTAGLDSIIADFQADISVKRPTPSPVALSEQTKYTEGDIVDINGKKFVVEQGAVDTKTGETIYTINSLDGKDQSRVVRESEIGVTEIPKQKVVFATQEELLRKITPVREGYVRVVHGGNAEGAKAIAEKGLYYMDGVESSANDVTILSPDTIEFMNRYFTGGSARNNLSIFDIPKSEYEKYTIKQDTPEGLKIRNDIISEVESGAALGKFKFDEYWDAIENEYVDQLNIGKISPEYLIGQAVMQKSGKIEFVPLKREDPTIRTSEASPNVKFDQTESGQGIKSTPYEPLPALPRTVEIAIAGTDSLAHFKSITDAEFDSLSNQGKVKPYDTAIDEVQAVADKTKPVAILMPIELEAIQKAKDLGLEVSHIKAPGASIIADGKVIRRDTIMLVYRPDDMGATIRYVDFYSRYKNYAEGTIPYHIELGKMLGYSDADIVTFIKKTFANEIGDEPVGSYIRRMIDKDSPVEIKAADRYIQLDREIKTKGRELSDINEQIRMLRSDDPKIKDLEAKRTATEDDLRKLNKENARYEEVLNEYSRKRSDIINDFARRQSPEFRRILTRRNINQLAEISAFRAAKLRRESTTERYIGADIRTGRMENRIPESIRVVAEARRTEREPVRPETSRITVDSRLPVETARTIEPPRPPTPVPPRPPTPPRPPEPPPRPPVPPRPPTPVPPRPPTPPRPPESPPRPPVSPREPEPPRRPPPDPKLPFKIKLPDGRELTQSQLDGAIAWKQGWCFKMLYPPYGQENIVNTRKPLDIVKYLEGPGSAYATVVARGVNVPPTILRDMGVFDLRLSVPGAQNGRTVRKATIRYKRDPKNIYAGASEI
jgi:hypothetical protein